MTIRNSSYAKFEHVIDVMARSDKFRDCKTSFQLKSGELCTERQFSYFANRLCELGIAEKRVKSRGWFSWTLYRLKMNKMDAWTKLTGLPF